MVVVARKRSTSQKQAVALIFGGCGGGLNIPVSWINFVWYGLNLIFLNVTKVLTSLSHIIFVARSFSFSSFVAHLTTTHLLLSMIRETIRRDAFRNTDVTPLTTSPVLLASTVRPEKVARIANGLFYPFSIAFYCTR